MRGRTPKPTALKILEGNPGHREIDPNTEPQPEIGLGEPPAHLRDDVEAVKHWMERGPQLVQMGTLGLSDAGLFAAYCQHHSRVVWLSRHVGQLRKKRKLTAKEEQRLGTYESQLSKTHAQMHKIGADFGIGAASRTRIKAAPPTEDADLTEMLFAKAKSKGAK